MNLAYFDHTARASTPRPEQSGRGGQHVLLKCIPASPGDRDSSGADTACEARAISARERWRLPTGLTEREMFAMHGVTYSTTKEDPL